MAASILIIVLSLALLVYWLRCTCQLLLNKAKVDADASFPLFAFPRVRADLRDGRDHRKLYKSLDRDYAVLTYLGRTSLADIEARLLVWDYRLMRCWYALARTAFPAQGRAALAEMADILAVLATKLRESTAVS
jgi:hypothetical protein